MIVLQCGRSKCTDEVFRYAVGGLVPLPPNRDVESRSNLVFATGTIGRNSCLRRGERTRAVVRDSCQLPDRLAVNLLDRGTRYIVVVATGGKFVGFSGRSNKVMAFKLPKAMQ